MKIALAWLDPSDPTDRRVAESLTRALRTLGHDVIWVGPRRRTGERATARVAGARLFRVSGGSRALLELHRRERVDVWHCHAFARSHEAFSRAAARGRWPLVVTLHLILKDYLPSIGGARGLRALVAPADFIVAVSRSESEELAALCPEARRRSRVVYNGVPRADGPPAPTPIRTPYALTVARLAPYKGIDLLLMAFARLRLERPDLKLVVCGRDQLGGAMPAFARRLGLSDAVVFTGELPWPRVRALLGGCAFFALASRRENLPAVVLEAMAEGKAVAAFAAGGVPELVRHGEEGLLARPGDVAALGRAMLALARDPARRARLGAAGRARSRIFSWERAAREYVRLYVRASAKRRRAAGTRSKK